MPENKKPSVSLPAEMLAEIEARRPKGSNRSEYIRQAVKTRFQLEDSDDWSSSDDSGDA